MAIPTEPFPTREAAKAAFAEHVSRGKVATFDTYGIDVVIGRREGVRFFDAYSTRSWINCHCNGGVFNLGHRHPQVVAAVRAALDDLDIGNHHLISGRRAQLAQRLSASTGGRLPSVVFGVSGGEAIDLALKLARGVTGREKVISAVGGYHGHTGLALAAGDAQYREPFRASLPGFEQVPFDDLDALDATLDRATAAVILEPIPATLGMPIPSPGYLPGVQALCRERGAKLIIDEVQTGLGRTGLTWGYQQEGLEPDCVVCGKGLSGGIYPLTATLLSAELAAFFDDKPFIHISTFGGAEIGLAAGNTVLDIIEAPGFASRVERLSSALADAFAPLPFELRRRGLMMAFKFPAPDAGLMATKMLYDAGVFAVYANNDTSALQFLPPLILSDAELEELIEKVTGAFS